MDICNLVWRSRAFNTTDTNALGCLLPETLILPLRAYLEAMNPPQTLQQLFTLSYNPALVALSIESLREQEDLMIENDQMRMEIGELRTRHGGPVNQRSLAALGADGGIKLGWAEYRLEVLKWLGDRGVEGVGELMFCTMKLLMNTGKN